MSPVTTIWAVIALQMVLGVAAALVGARWAGRYPRPSTQGATRHRHAPSDRPAYADDVIKQHAPH